MILKNTSLGPVFKAHVEGPEEPSYKHDPYFNQSVGFGIVASWVFLGYLNQILTSGDCKPDGTREERLESSLVVCLHDHNRVA